MDEIADLADRCRSMSEFEFEVEWDALTEDERVELLVLLDQRPRSARSGLRRSRRTSASCLPCATWSRLGWDLARP